ncbi:MAG: hypothetical protein MUF23_17380, partial [Pirellula sp.]|nr:hypothetical protein [Pirellula sp.]
MPPDNASPSETTSSDSNTFAPRKRAWRWWLWIPLALFLVLAALPSLLGSKWVYQKLVDRLALEGFQLQIDAAEIGWLRPIAFRGIRLEQIDAPKLDTSTKTRKMNLLEVEAIESNRSLIGYLVAGRDLGQLKIRKPRLDIELLEET